ncbi:MAG: hypothetical protein HOB32_07775 [Nitrospina sp.]|jgi:hypothetical protein|nr:hypothetical protein [Nitrospina sp.]
MNNQKEINTLINLSRNVGQAFCDKDTFEETSSNQIVQKWKYRGVTFKIIFPESPSDGITVSNCYAEMRRQLREINLEAPSEFSMRLVSNYSKVAELVLLDELWEELGTDDKI